MDTTATVAELKLFEAVDSDRIVYWIAAHGSAGAYHLMDKLFTEFGAAGARRLRRAFKVRQLSMEQGEATRIKTDGDDETVSVRAVFAGISQPMVFASGGTWCE